MNSKSEFEQIMAHIKNGENFLLSGGAGSGKTYSLVEVINQVIRENPSTSIACITYTNAAVKEISQRVDNKNLFVSTIHEFLWDNIKHFQREIKTSIIELINDESKKSFKIKDLNKVEADFYKDIEKIRYEEYLKLKDGAISHDEVLILAEYMYGKYPKLCDLLKDRYKFIFVDEYQDTNPLVVKIFLEHFEMSNKKCIIGFFGDAMQSIYDSGIGDLNAYRVEGKVKEVVKKENRRNPQKVIDLANKIRIDGIIQQASNDLNAPNMDKISHKIKEGKSLFLYTDTEIASGDLNSVREKLSKDFSWNFNDSKATKELNLTHNLIAGKAGFRHLMDIYDKDPIMDFITRIKKEIKNKNITIDINRTFDEVAKIANPLIKNKTPHLNIIMEKHLDLYRPLKDKPWAEISQIYFSKDQLIDDKKQDVEDENKPNSKRDDLINHLLKIQKTIFYYENNNIVEFLKNLNSKIKRLSDKDNFRKNIESLKNVEDKSIEEIIDLADSIGFVKKDDKLTKFQEKNSYLFSRVKDIKFAEFQKLYEYLEGFTPFSTQHKIKGAEFDNVLVILDNGNWSKYNFENLFKEAGSENVLNRTKKIFYVCCTRSKENLAVFYNMPSPQVLSTAKEWFGAKNIIKLP